MLQPIFLPPSAVSIPRTEVPMEAIIGVHVRPPPSQRDFGCRKCPTNSGPGNHRFPPRTCATPFAASFLSLGLACKVVDGSRSELLSGTHGQGSAARSCQEHHRNFFQRIFLIECFANDFFILHWVWIIAVIFPSYTSFGLTPSVHFCLGLSTVH